MNIFIMNEQEYYYFIEFKGDWDQELSHTLLEEFGAIGIQELDLAEVDVDRILGEKSYCGGDLPEDLIEVLESEGPGGVKIFFLSKSSAESAVDYLNQREVKGEFSLRREKNEDWNISWKKHYEKISLLSGKIIIYPSWEKEGLGDEPQLKIFIEPGQGFGTGTHETTQLCLEYLLDLNFQSVLDFGCGSGILGVGAQVLKSSSSCAYYDIDEESLENCKVNLSLNSVDKGYQIYKKDEKRGLIKNSYDLIFANILAPVLIDESRFLTSFNARFIILSGLLVEQKDQVLKHYLGDYEVREIKQRNDWMAILLEKKE